MLRDLTDKEWHRWLEANRKRPSWVHGGDTALTEILSVAIPVTVRYLCKQCASSAYAELDSPAHKETLCDVCFVAMMDEREAAK